MEQLNWTTTTQWKITWTDQYQQEWHTVNGTLRTAQLYSQMKVQEKVGLITNVKLQKL